MTSRMISTAKMDAMFRPQKRKRHQVRREGPWTTEEVQYVAALMEEFKQGHLPVKRGMSMRFFLAIMLECNPKRISRKYDGTNYNGKLLYEQSKEILDPADVTRRREKLQELENKYESSIVKLPALDAAEDPMQPRAPISLDQSSPFKTTNSFPLNLPGTGMLNSQQNWIQQGSIVMPPYYGTSLPQALGMGSMGAKVGMGWDTKAFPGFGLSSGACSPALFHGHVGLKAETAPNGRRDPMNMLSYSPMISGYSQTDPFSNHFQYATNANFIGRPAAAAVVGGAGEVLMPGTLPRETHHAELPEQSTNTIDLSSCCSSRSSSPANSDLLHSSQPLESLPHPKGDSSSRCCCSQDDIMCSRDQKAPAAANESFLPETSIRQRLMDALSRSSSPSKKSRVLEKGSSKDNSKRRRMH